jgi:hypothetical protein
MCLCFQSLLPMAPSTLVIEEVCWGLQTCGFSTVCIFVEDGVSLCYTKGMICWSWASGFRPVSCSLCSGTSGFGPGSSGLCSGNSGGSPLHGYFWGIELHGLDQWFGVDCWFLEVVTGVVVVMEGAQ